MNLEPTSEQDDLRQSVRRFLADHTPIHPFVRTMLDDSRGTTSDAWNGLASLGVLGLLVPERFGGAGLGMVEMGVVLDEMGRALLPGPFVSSAVGAVTAVLIGGSAEDHAALLPGLASGTTIGTVPLLPAPDADPPRASEEHGEWRLTGMWTQVPDLLAATLLLVPVPCSDGVGLFAVEPNAGGVGREATDHVDQTRKVGRLAFRDVTACRLGGDAAAAVAAVTDHLLIAMASDAVGAAQAVLDLAVDYAKQRVQFDKPIGTFQAVQHLCADMLLALQLARGGAMYAQWAADHADAAERRRAALTTRAFAGDRLSAVGADAIQVFGGIGYTWEHDAHLYYKRLLTLRHFLGGASTFLDQLAEHPAQAGR